MYRILGQASAQQGTFKCTAELKFLPHFNDLRKPLFSMNTSLEKWIISEFLNFN